MLLIMNASRTMLMKSKTFDGYESMLDELFKDSYFQSCLHEGKVVQSNGNNCGFGWFNVSLYFSVVGFILCKKHNANCNNRAENT